MINVSSCVPAFRAPKFDIINVNETSFNVTWEPMFYTGVHVVHYVEYRKEGETQ